MADEKEDEFALTKPNGLPAYPKIIYKETDKKNKDGTAVLDEGTVVKNPEEHKKLLSEAKPNSKAPDWGKK
jgi:hypothetical protein